MMHIHGHKGGKFSLGKVILIVLDSVGVGALPDAADYGDEGANTLKIFRRFYQDCIYLT